MSTALRHSLTLADTPFVTTFARLLPRRDCDTARSLRLIAGAVAALSAAAVLLVPAPPAHAVVTEIGGSKVGLQAVNEISFFDALQEWTFNEGENANVAKSVSGYETFRNASAYPVVHGANTYVIYWDPNDRYNPDWQHLINVFMQSTGAASGSTSNVFAVDTQYTDFTNAPAYYRSTFRAAYTDTHPYPAKVCPTLTVTRCLTDAQLQTQLREFIVLHQLPTGMSSIYYVLTPPGVSVCVDAAGTRCTDFERSENEIKESKYESASYKAAICSYHAASNPGESPLGDANTILYGVIPWSAGSAGTGSQQALTAGQAAYCQDGGWNPSSKPAMERERVKPRNAQEEAEFQSKTGPEKEQLEATKALQAAHDEEPNQLACPNLEDGRCDAGLADLIVNQIAVEQQNIVTDPLLNAWHDEANREATDECRNFFLDGEVGGTSIANPESGAGTLYNQTIAAHHYYLNMAFNLAGTLLPYPGVPCMPGVNVIPEFTSPNTASNGEIVGFDGMESNITLDAQYIYNGGVATKTYAKYKWEFGDGTPAVEGYAPGAPICETPWLSPCAASVFHSYQYGGTYNVTLTATDTVGNVASVTHPLVIVGPPPPSEPAAGGGGGGGGGGTSGGGGATPGAGTSTGGGTAGSPGAGGGSQAGFVPPPAAATAVTSHSLRRVLRKGLTVRYSVNEQVAGRFEVLLSRATARRLGITGPAAVGLPAGTPPQVVIGKALLVTTAAGRNTVTIQFSKRTASKLGRMHSVPLLLRLFVRNAASHPPVTTTVLTSITLSG